MDAAKMPTIIIRAVDIVISCILLGIYYGTNTSFDLTSESSNNFGQTTIIMFFILSIGAIAMEIVKIPPQHKMILCGYNIIAAVFYLTAGIIILSTWSNPPIVYVIEHKNGGLWTGSFCIIQTVVMILGAVFYAKAIKSGD